MNSYQETIFFHYILSNPIFLNVAKAEYFTSQNIKEIFEIAKDHALRYKEAPSKDQLIQLIQIKGLQEKFSDDMVEALYNTKQRLTEFDDEWLENNVGPWIKVRNLDNVMRKAIAYMKTIKVTAENASEIVEKVRHMLSSETVVDFSFDLGSSFFNPDAHMQTRLARTSSGYDYVDICTKGGYWKGSLVVLVGAPKSGKCVQKDTLIYIKNKRTKYTEVITIQDFHNKAGETSVDTLEKPDNKFTETFNVHEYQVETSNGWKDILASGKTVPFQMYKIELENGLFLLCADDHILIKSDLSECFLQDLTIKDSLMTMNGISKIEKIEKLDYSEEMYDIEVDSEEHTYFTNGVLSHNSSWLCNLAAKSVMNGFNTAYITLELQEELVHMRIGSNMLNVPLDDYENFIKDKDLLKQKLNNLKQHSLLKLGDLHVKEFPASTASSTDISNYLVKAQEILGYKFDNVFIDYLNIMKNWRNPNTENTYMKIKQISEDIRAMGQENNWAVISVTQTNRCLSPESIVSHREHGKIPLKELQVNDYILGDSGYIKVTNIYNNKDTKTYKIKTKSGKEIICSANHIFPVNDTQRAVAYIKAGDNLYSKLGYSIIEDEIISIEEYGIIDTIDIEVDSKNRLFFANDILTHNSGIDSTDSNVTTVSESTGLLFTVDLLFGIITNPEMKARGEYFLKCLANRVAGYENTKKRFTIDWKYCRIEEDRNSPIQDMEFYINNVAAGHKQARGQRTTADIHTVINENTAILEQAAISNIGKSTTENIDSINRLFNL